MDEIWKDIYFIENGVIYDYRGLYQVSNEGRVKSLNYNHTGKEQIMKARNTHGYEYVALYKNSKQKNFLIHRLVALVFLSDFYFEGADVDHIDTNPSNNHVSNLRWRTRKENCNNDLSKKHYSEAKKGEKHGRAILVDRFTLDGQYIDTMYQFEYVEELGFVQGNISSCCRGRLKTHKGFIFKYHEEVE